MFTPPPNQVSGVNLRVTQVDFKEKFVCQVLQNENCEKRLVIRILNI